jgi:hypothetical protein
LNGRALRRPNSRWLTIAAVAVLGLFVNLGGCGAGDGPATDQRESPIPHPSGATELVLQFSAKDGFLGNRLLSHFTEVPQFSLYGDGTVIRAGVVSEGSVVPNLETAKLPEESVQAILTAARQAGLLRNDVDYGQPNVNDLGDTDIYVCANGTEYWTYVYALGAEPTGAAYIAGGEGLSSRQKKERVAINQFYARLCALQEFVKTGPIFRPYESSRLVAFHRKWPDYEGPGGVQWPLADFARAEGPRDYSIDVAEIVVSGKDLETLLPLLKSATPKTLWESGGNRYEVTFRPLLPNETHLDP